MPYINDAPPGYYRTPQGELVKRRPADIDHILRLAAEHPLPPRTDDAKPA